MIEGMRRYVPIAHPDLIEVVKERMLRRGWVYISDVDVHISPLTNIVTHAFGLMTLDEWIEYGKTLGQQREVQMFCIFCGEGYRTEQAVRNHLALIHPTEEVIA